LNGETNRARQRQNSAIIVADVRRFAHVDGVLGIHSFFTPLVQRHDGPAVIREPDNNE
jgi:hypothetical protein